MIGMARQNNSGGYFIENEIVNKYVAIEDDDLKKIYERYYDITVNYSESCSCCGSRWDGVEINDCFISEEGLTLDDFNFDAKPEDVNCIFHKKDGTKIACEYIE